MKPDHPDTHSSADNPHRKDPKMGELERLAEKRIGDLLVSAGLIKSEQLHKALSIQAQQGGGTVRILISLGYIEPDQFLAFLSKQPPSERIDLSRLETPVELLELIPGEIARKYAVFPLDIMAGHLRVASITPLDAEALAELENAAKIPVNILLCPEENVRAAIRRYYGTDQRPAGSLEDLHGPLKLSVVAGLIHEIDSFPALPETVHRTREAMDSPRSSISDVSRIIIMDPPIAAKVLSVANSVAYGFPRRIEDITLAITLLGLRETYSIVFAAAVLNLLEKTRHFDYRRFWIESMCCAAATRFVLKASGRKDLTGVFAAGLLHDIGRLALAEVAPALCARIPTGLEGDELLAAEAHAIGVIHTEAGYELAQHWRLPDEVAEPIRFHHNPGQATKAQEEVAVIALASAMARAEGASLEENRSIFERNAVCLAILGLDLEGAEAMLDDYLSRRDGAIRDVLSG